MGVYGDRVPAWKFIAPLSPWWGGYWEQMVQSVKSSLQKSMVHYALPRTELEMVLLEREATVKSLPLTFIGDSPDVIGPLSLLPTSSSASSEPFVPVEM